MQNNMLQAGMRQTQPGHSNLALVMSTALT